MSVLEACGLFVGAEFYLRWNAKQSVEPFVPVVIMQAKLTADMNPRKLNVLASRKYRLGEEEADSLALQIYQHDEGGIPSICEAKTGQEMVWTLSKDTMVRGKRYEHADLDNLLRSSSASSTDILTAYTRPIRALSYSVYNKLVKFPSIPSRESSVPGNCIRSDIRADTSCSLMEWESLVQRVCRSLNIPVQHDPLFSARDVPRYDKPEMSLYFPTLHSLLRLFRHLTVDGIRKIIYKEKKKRRRGKSSGSELLQVVGDVVCQENAFLFTIGSRYYSDIPMSSHFKFPVLYRETMEWDELDRMFVHDLQFQWMKGPSVRSFKEEEDGIDALLQKPGRKRIRESFMGLKWIRSAEQDAKKKKTMRFHSFNANDVHGVLHFCVPSFVFVDSLYIPQIKALISKSTEAFDLH